MPTSAFISSKLMFQIYTGLSDRENDVFDDRKKWLRMSHTSHSCGSQLDGDSKYNLAAFCVKHDLRSSAAHRIQKRPGGD